MHITQTRLKDCLILQPKVFGDERGYFFESFNEQSFAKLTGLAVHFVQDNQSFSSYGVLRGLHYQRGDFSQSKLVRVIKGSVLDVAVDLRPDSDTYGKHVAVLLTEDSNTQLFIPRGFAHGFVVTSETAIFAYKCDNFYNKASEGGLRFDDPAIAIDWTVPESKILVSEKDRLLPFIEHALPVF